MAPETDDEFPAAELSEVTRLLLKAANVAEVLQRVTDAARALVPGVDVVSLTLRDGRGRLHTPALTAPVAEELDALQERLAEGPCLDAALISGASFVESTDLAGDGRWPAFGPGAAGLGLTAVLATPLVAEGDEHAGALNLYARHRDMWEPAVRGVTLILAGHAALALAGTRARDRAALTETNLRRAIDSRDVIGQAKGILMARRGITADQAFALLSRTSQDLNIKIGELARALADRPEALDPPR
ncbi:GAF and ANTAR domain-containing protein [Actinomadura parmotrematis]|uniref:GAF and ANTAR domain-containing protein n=1 Tax=Actinomadura parmotrematis TaxID=2864039 RepID=A0ABS7FPW6_9ACTN|nr:GAF and ANTAR domain-containing protein [Actinomadura parmotrematis]MBW8482432.1 GAF and ANTAR domain-containing protein [Actinomadura parmotrematis]